MYKKDTNAWVFNLAQPKPFRLRNAGEFAIYCHQQWGPIFGKGADIGVVDNSNANSNSRVVPSSSYEYGGVHLLNGQGKVNFKAVDIEVFLIKH